MRAAGHRSACCHHQHHHQQLQLHQQLSLAAPAAPAHRRAAVCSRPQTAAAAAASSSPPAPSVPPPPGWPSVAAYDADRLARDQQARGAMAAQAAADAAAGGSKPGAWKWVVRKHVWDEMEASGVARSPRPVHHRIPNFAGAEAAAERLAALPEFRAAATVKCNPDTPQKMVRGGGRGASAVLSPRAGTLPAVRRRRGRAQTDRATTPRPAPGRRCALRPWRPARRC